MNFGDALEKLKAGKNVARSGWDNRSLGLLDPGPNAEMTEPYVYIDRDGAKEPYTYPHSDVLAENWETT